MPGSNKATMRPNQALRFFKRQETVPVYDRLAKLYADCWAKQAKDIMNAITSDVTKKVLTDIEASVVFNSSVGWVDEEQINLMNNDMCMNLLMDHMGFAFSEMDLEFATCDEIALATNAIDQKRFYAKEQYAEAGIKGGSTRTKIPALIRLKFVFPVSTQADKFIMAFVDTEAQNNVVKRSVLEEHGAARFIGSRVPPRKVCGFNGSEVVIVNRAELHGLVGTRRIVIECDVTDHLTNPMILGIPALNKLGVLRPFKHMFEDIAGNNVIE